MSALRPSILLDRDGTLHRELTHAPRGFDALELFAGVPERLAALVQRGFALVVITNQSAVARGALEFGELQRVHAELARTFAAAGAPLAALYVCPHHPSEGAPPYRRECACRKPKSGMLRRAAHELELDLARSWMIGAALRDMQAGLAVGTRAVLVETGKGAQEKLRLGALAERVVVVPDITAAIEHVLAHSQGK